MMYDLSYRHEKNENTKMTTKETPAHRYPLLMTLPSKYLLIAALQMQHALNIRIYLFDYNLQFSSSLSTWGLLGTFSKRYRKVSFFNNRRPLEQTILILVSRFYPLVLTLPIVNMYSQQVKTQLHVPLP